MIKRKDGSYSQRGLWDNIRANKGSGKKPTAEMLKQERKIKANMANGGINNPGFKALPMSVQQNIKANMAMGGYANNMVASVPPMPNRLMQNGGLAPQTSAGVSVLQEAMLNTQMGNPMMPVSGNGMMQMKKGGMNSYGAGGKMPADIARARFMAAANGNSGAAKAKASQYGYKLQEGGMSNSVERMGEAEVTKKRSIGDKVAGKFRQAKKALGMNPYKSTDADQGRAAVFSQEKESNAGIMEARAQAATTNKKQNRNLAQRIGDEFPTYLNLSSDRNVLTDIADLGTAAAVKVGLPQQGQMLQNAKKATQAAGKSVVGKTIDLINPLSIGANILGGGIGAGGDMTAGQMGDASRRLATAGTIAATKGVLGKSANMLASPVGRGTSRLLGNKIGYGVQHQLAHAGQHTALSPLLMHKSGGTIKDMYMMKKGGQFPERYKKMGFKGVDQPKKTTSGNKSHAVVTKVDGNYKLIRFGQKGKVGSPDGSARNKSFKARHAKNIAKGKSSAAYWANKVKW